MGASQRDQIGTSCRQNAVHLIGIHDVAHRNDRYERGVANAVGQRRLKHTAIDRACSRCGFAGGNIDKIDACVLETLRDLDRFGYEKSEEAPPIEMEPREVNTPEGKVTVRAPRSTMKSSLV